MSPVPSPFSIRNIKLFIAFRIFFNARFYYPVFTILFLDYGLTIEQFALLNTVWAITIVCAEVPSGALADIIGRKQLIVATSLLMVVEMGIIAFIPLDNISLVFWAFLINRVLSGLAEAMASGADEAIAYDSLADLGLKDQWPKVLSLQMRLKSIAGIITASTGALIYDPDMINRFMHWLNLETTVNQQQSMRFPIYLTLILAFFSTATSLMFVESGNNSRPADNGRGLYINMVTAMKMTMKAGRWILQTPFALAIIVCGMFYDHILRMLITMTSQYFRLIQLPEASFGVISAALSLLGLVIPKICENMVEKNSPQKNMLILFAITVTGLFLLSGFYPYIGLVPVGTVYIGIMMVSFFTSHYLNRITSSDQRATVLSFKGLVFNLGYGLIGVFFAVLMQQMRVHQGKINPQWNAELIEQQSFIASVGWFPWYTLLMFCLLLLFFRRLLCKVTDHKVRG